MKQNFYHIILFLIASLIAYDVPAQLWEEEASSDGSEPTARHENAFVQANGNLYLIGGRHSRPVNEYDPVTKIWTEKSTPPMQMHHFQAVSWDNKIYIIGAFTGNFPDETPVPNVYIYDPAADTWTESTEIPAARRRGSAGAVAHNNKIYLVGGITNGHNSGAVAWFDEFNPATGEWTVMDDAPQARDHFHVAVVDGKIVAAGGRTTSYETGELNNLTVNTADVYDFSSGWTTITEPILTPRAGTTVAANGNELIVMGGETAGQLDAHNETEALNISTGTWRSLASMVTGRHGTQAAVYNGKVYIAAGSSQKGGNGTTELTSLEVLDIAIATSVQDARIDKLLVSPNPSDGYLAIEPGPQGEYAVMISDPSGKVISTEITFDGKLNLRDMEPGIYFLQITEQGLPLGMYRIVKH